MSQILPDKDTPLHLVTLHEENEREMPLVSLIVPVYNASQYLPECLGSIASQSFRDIEIIVVDDESTDGSIGIAQEFCDRDARFRLVRIHHGGVSKARNTGIDLAKGKYIGFVDADDCLHQNAIERMIDTLTTTGAKVCVASFERGTRFKAHKINTRQPLVMDYQSAMRDAMYQKIILNAPWGMIMERSMLGDDMRFREGIRYEDLDAFYRFYEKADRIAYLPEKLYFYRQLPGSFIHTWSNERLDALDVTDRMADFICNRYPEIGDAARDRRFSAHFNILLLMLRLGINDSHQISRCLDVVKDGRCRALSDSHVRLKNKLGAIASYGGLGFLRFISKFYD